MRDEHPAGMDAGRRSGQAVEGLAEPGEPVDPRGADGVSTPESARRADLPGGRGGLPSGAPGIGGLPSPCYRPAGTLDWAFDVRTAEGGRRRIELGTANLDVAQKRRSEHLATAQARSGLLAAPDAEAEHVAPGSVEWALAEHLERKRIDLAEATQGVYATQAGHLVRLLGGVAVAELRRVHVDAYLAQREAEGVGAETRRKELVLFRAALRTVRQLGVDAAEPEAVLLPRLRSAYVPRERWLEVEEFERVMVELAPLRRRQVLVACYVGARRSELRRIEPADIDWKRNVIRIRQSKPRNTVRYVPLHPRLREELQRFKPGPGSLLGTFNNLYRAIAQACERAGVPRFTLNDCRRTFGSWMLQRGAQPYTVGKLLGHASTQMVSQVYGRLSDDSLRDAVARLPDEGGTGQESQRGKPGGRKGR